jgi:cytochrome P450
VTADPATEVLTFDFSSAEANTDAYWQHLRELQRAGPVVRVGSLGGYWAATSYDVVRRVSQDWHTFSSAQGVALNRPDSEVMPWIMPIEIDPPRQKIYRRQVGPHFTAKVLASLEDAIRAIADELIDPFIDDGSCDVSVQFARRFPGTVFFRLIVPCGDEEFRTVEPSARAISFESNEPEKFSEAAANLRAWAARVFASREDGPATDGPGDAVHAVQHLPDTGALFADHELLSGLQILAQGGIGTSASVVGVVMKSLAERPSLQDRVRSDPSLIPSLIEECVRLEPPVPLMFRTAARDVDLEGQHIRAGDKLGLFFGAANRDPAVFDRPDELDIDRTVNPHLGFGGGPHRCIGSNLARLQIRVAIEQLVARLGAFRIPEGASVIYRSMQARGPFSVPLEFDGESPLDRLG